MQAANLAAATMRTSESGLVWEEKITGAQGSLELLPRQTFRVRAAGATTVTIDGILAATMSSGEVIIFNCGEGDPEDSKATITVAIAGANAFVQVARADDRKKA
jgi:hypothetical protein